MQRGSSFTKYSAFFIPFNCVSYIELTLIGILLDGVFIYERQCTSTGTYPNDLDSSGGHISETDYTNGQEEYHYHIINEPFFGDGTDDYLIFEGLYLGF